ncbi:MAG: TIGR03663 family protein [Acidobacteriota bacterium]|nr:TIGR03663 family protein [Acidobacteriota bacterium]
MSTGSTKSNRNKQAKSVPTSRVRTTEPAVPDEVRAADIPHRTWLLSSIGIMLVGAVLRLYDLPLVPFHHDEGVNGNFLVRLVREGIYHYDPENYHGPTLYYFAAVIPWILRFLFGPQAQNTYGLTTFNVRLIPALFGLGTIWMVLLLHRRLGKIGSLAAAALLAVSPGAVYLSRYFIHESLFVFFTFGIVVASLKYYEEGHPIYLILAAASAALLFATKETWIISVGVLLLALLSTHVYRWLRRVLGIEANGKRKRNGNERSTGQSEWFEETSSRLGDPINIAIWAVVAVGVFAGVGLLFYSSFLTNWKGVSDSLLTFKVWTKTGKTAHVHEWWMYIKWLLEEEAPLLLLGTLGAVIAVIKPKNIFALFCAFWAFGILAAYSLVPYKTPWLALNFIVPLALIGGYVFQRVYEYGGNELLRPLILLGVLALGSSVYQMVQLNFFKYDDDHYAYVYAHTRRETLAMLNEIDKVVSRSGTGLDTGITIVSPDYWPLPWYFRDYRRVGYYGQVSSSNEPIIIASEAQQDAVQSAFGDRYRLVGSKFALRPGVELLLFVRKDLAGP